MRTVRNNPAAALATQEGMLFAFFETPDRTVYANHYGHQRIWIYLTRDGRLVMVVRWRVYNERAGHSVPTAPAVARYARERQIRGYLRRYGITPPPLRVSSVPQDTPPDIARIATRPYSKWSEAERRRMGAYGVELTPGR